MYIHGEPGTDQAWPGGFEGWATAPRTGGIGGAIAHRCHLIADLTSDTVV